MKSCGTPKQLVPNCALSRKSVHLYQVVLVLVLGFGILEPAR